jgi:hypothetical protein
VDPALPRLAINRNARPIDIVRSVTTIMRRMKTTFSLALLMVLVAGSVRAERQPGGLIRFPADDGSSRPQQDKSQDVSGTWALTVETTLGTGTPSVTFKQDGEKLTGTYSSQIFGEQQVAGTVKGNAINFSFTGAVEGTSITVSYSGTVEKDTMKGTVTLGDLGEGTFTGKKK